MILRCDEDDIDAIYAVVNDAAWAYEDVISADCWKEPYMPSDELRSELEAGVIFPGCLSSRLRIPRGPFW